MYSVKLGQWWLGSSPSSNCRQARVKWQRRDTRTGFQQTCCFSLPFLLLCAHLYVLIE